MADSSGLAETIEQLAKILECPVCFAKLKPPISTCERGHGVCMNCSKLMTSCGLCRKRIRNGSDEQNTLLNQIVETLVTDDETISILGAKQMIRQCKYAPEGCMKSFATNRLEDHQDICCYRKEKCASCKQAEMPMMKMNDHFKVCTKVKAYVQSAKRFSENITVNCTIPEINPDNRVVFRHKSLYISEIETYFIVQRIVDNEEKTYFCVQYAGADQENAKNYKYEIKINQGMPAPNESYFSYSGLCSPYFYSSEKIKKEKGTVKLNLKYIFLTDDYRKSRKWDYIIKICKLS